jgi:hypothetical protein
VDGSGPVLAFAVLRRQGVVGPDRTPELFKQPEHVGSTVLAPKGFMKVAIPVGLCGEQPEAC